MTRDDILLESLLEALHIDYQCESLPYSATEVQAEYIIYTHTHTCMHTYPPTYLPTFLHTYTGAQHDEWWPCGG